MFVFCGFTWTRTKIDGLTVRSNKPLYDKPNFAEGVGLEPTSRFLDHRFSRPADYQLSHPSNNFVAGGGFERSDLKVMSLVSYHCSTPQYFLVPSERLELSRLTALVPKTNVYYQFHHKGLF